MKKVNLLLGMLFIIAPVRIYAQPIIADHTIVDKYADIPDEYIAKVKTMLLNIAGESHSRGYRYGLLLLAAQDPKFAVNLKMSDAPEAPTDQYLRVSGTVRFPNANWHNFVGEEDVWTTPWAVNNFVSTIKYMDETASNPISAMGIGWCYDMYNNGSAGTTDPVHGCRWQGRSAYYVNTNESGNPVFSDDNGWLQWGIDKEDSIDLGGPRVTLNMYIRAIEAARQASSKTVVFFTTTPVDFRNADYPLGREDIYQAFVKHECIRNHVKATSDAVLFDYADILCWSEAGEQRTETWNGHTYQKIRTEYVSPEYDGGSGGCHINEAACLRLGKAMWWMLARIAGWGLTTPTKAGTPSGATSLCQNPVNQTYTTTGATGAISYIWSITPANAGVITGSAETATVDFDNSFTGNAQIAVTGQNGYGNGQTSDALTVTIGAAPAKASTPSGATDLCLNPENQTYTAAGATGADSYLWAITPANAGVITGSAETATVDFDDSFTGNAQITVTGQNGCGYGQVSNALSVTIGNIPSKAGTPSGATALCLNPVNQTYTTTGAVNANSYIWAISPAYAGIVAGSTETAIIDFDNSFTGTAQITVTGQNGYGNGQTSDALTVTIGAAPAKASTPIGAASLCLNPANQTYTTTGAVNANSYIWAISPAYAGIVAGSTETAIIDFDNSFTGTAQITVTGQNGYGNGQTSDALTVTIGAAPAKASTPIGAASLCLNPANQTYTTTGAEGASSYTWSITPANAGVITGSDETATVDFDNSFAGTAQIAVTGQNSCGYGQVSNALAVTIGNIPSKAGTPSGATDLCLNPENQTYTAAGATGADSYLWAITPANAGVITGSAATATVDFDDSFTGNAQITVTGQNGCGYGQVSNALSVTIGNIPSKAGTPSGATDLCLNPENQTFTTAGAAGASSYIWSITPTSAGVITGSAATATVDFDNSFTGTAQIAVTGQNSCGYGQTSDVLLVNVTCTEINSIENNTIKIYPNPVSEDVNIEFDNQSKDYIIELVSLTGQVLITKQSNQSKEMLNVHGQKGAYFIKIYYDKKVLVDKLIIE